MRVNRWLPLGLFLLLAFSAAGIGALATATSVTTWYPTLAKPTFNPPSSVFGPVWSVLYVLMAVSTWRVWQKGDPLVGRRTVSLYSAQLTLNALWSILFFGLHRPGAALIEIVVLWGLLVFILVRTWKLDHVAAGLWAPYVAWVSFAAVLNGAIWMLNR